MKNLQTQLLVVLLLFTCFALSEVFNISRSIPDFSDWTRGTDSFKVSSICDKVGTHSSAFCETFSASKTDGDQCSCLCPSDRATFIFHDGKPTCLDNNKTRDLLEDCAQMIHVTWFRNEKRTDPLYMLGINHRRPLTLRGLNCIVNMVSSWYIGCNGTKLPLTTNITTGSMFTMRQEFGWYTLKVNPGSNTDLLSGRIINVGISCLRFFGARSSSTIKHCLLFKLVGTTTCPEEKPSSSTVAVPTSSSKPAVVTVPSIATTTKIVSTIAASSVTTFIAEPPAAATTTATTTAITQPLPTSQPTISTEIQPTTTVNPHIDFSETVDTVPTTEEGTPAIDRPSSGRDQQKGDSSSSPSLGLILGVTVSALTLVFFIAGVFIYRRRNSSKKRHKRTGSQDTNTVMMSPQTNSAFQPDVETGYTSLGYSEPTYASTYNVPKQPDEASTSKGKKKAPWEERPLSNHSYAAVNRPVKEPVYNSPDEPKEPLSDSAGEYENPSPRPKRPEHSGHLYTDLDSSKAPHVYGPESAQEAIYNVPEEPLSDNTGEQEKDPVYNIIEAPIPDISDGPNSYGPGPIDEPVYNVLEDDGPGATDDPVYNTLEGPDPNGQDNQPVYAVVNKKGKRNQGGVPGEHK